MLFHMFHASYKIPIFWLSSSELLYRFKYLIYTTLPCFPSAFIRIPFACASYVLRSSIQASPFLISFKNDYFCRKYINSTEGKFDTSNSEVLRRIRTMSISNSESEKTKNRYEHENRSNRYLTLMSWRNGAILKNNYVLRFRIWIMSPTFVREYDEQLFSSVGRNHRASMSANHCRGTQRNNNAFNLQRRCSEQASKASV